MTNGQSFRSALQTPLSGQRFVTIFPLMMAIPCRDDLLSVMGYADAGWPRLISAAVMASAFIVYTLLSMRDPWRAVADRSRGVRLAYAGFYLLAAEMFLLLAFAGRFADPIFWASGAIVLLICLLAWFVGRKQARA